MAEPLTPTQVPGRNWCAQHHHFHRDCTDCVEADFDSLVERINEAWAAFDGRAAEVERLRGALKLARHKIRQTQAGQYPEGQALDAAVYAIDTALEARD